MISVEHWSNHTDRLKPNYSKKSLSSWQSTKNSHWLVWDRTRASEVAGRRLIAWPITPYESVSEIHKNIVGEKAEYLMLNFAYPTTKIILSCGRSSWVLESLRRWRSHVRVCVPVRLNERADFLSYFVRWDLPVVKISPELVTGPEQGTSSGRIATFSLWTDVWYFTTQGNEILLPNWQKESWWTFEETSGYVRPVRFKKWPTSMKDIMFIGPCIVNHCDIWRIKDQINVTCYFISLMCSTYFGH